MTITETAYKKIQKYASRFARKREDAEDIAQEACLLLLEHPTSVVMTNKFLFTLVRRGYWHNKYKQSHGKKIVKNQDILLADFEEQANLISEDTNLENVYSFLEYRAKLRGMTQQLNKNTWFTDKEYTLFKKILNDKNTVTADRTHYENIKNKLRKVLV